MSATEKMKELVTKYSRERNWAMLDCLNIWLHNGSGTTARSKFSDLVLTGIMQDFYENMRYNYSADEIDKAINNFQNDLKSIDIDLLYADYYAMKRNIIPQISDAMIERIREKTVSEEEKRLVFIFGKYGETVSNPVYGILSKHLEIFIKSLKILYSAIFIDDLGLQHPEDYLRKLGLILKIDWVVSKRPQSSKEFVAAEWSYGFLKEFDSYDAKVSPPKIVEEIEDYIRLLNQKDMVAQLVFYDLLLEKDVRNTVPFWKTETSIKDQMEFLVGSSVNIPFRSGICERVGSNILLSPFVKHRIANALDEVKRKRMASVVDNIVEALKVFESENKLLFNVRVISDSPKVWRIEGLTSSLSILVMPWCKTSDVQHVKDISQKTSATVVFAGQEQKLSTLKALFGEDERIAFCFATETQINYTPFKNEILHLLINGLTRGGKQVRCISQEIVTQPVELEYFSLPIDSQRFNERLLQILRNCKQNVRIMSPYIDKTTFTDYLSNVPKNVRVQIITSNTGEENHTRREWENLVRNGMMIYVKKLKLLSENEVAQRKIEALHGRCLIVDDEFVVVSMPDFKRGLSGSQKGELVEIITSVERIRIRQEDFEEWWINPEEKLFLDILAITWNPKTIK